MNAKDAMSALDVRAAVRELQALRGSRIDKAYEVAPGELLLRLRGLDPPRKVEVSILVGKALHVTKQPRATPEKPTSFVMQLRKHLTNGFIDDVRQHGFDRVIEFVSRRKDGTYVLVVELFADGNVILVKDDRILAPLFTQSWAHREVRPGVDWVPAPTREDPSAIPLDEWTRRVRASNADAVRTLATELGLGGPLAEEVCLEAGVAKGAKAADLPDADVAALRDAVGRLLARADAGDLAPVVVLKGGAKVDVAPFPFRAHATRETESHATFHEALDAYFGRADAPERADPRLVKLQAERVKVERMLAAQTAAVQKFETGDAEARRKGDLLYAHFDLAQRVTRALFDASKAQGWKTVQERLAEGRAAGHPDALAVGSVEPHTGAAVLELADEEGRKVKVRVDLRKSVQENADALYESSKKLREKRKGALASLERTRERLRELDERGLELVAEAEEKATRKPPTKRFWFESFRWFFTSDDHLVMAGRDVKSNERLVAKHLEDNDRYLHADVAGAPSVVVKAKEGAVSERALEEAAAFAGSMSRAWAAGHAQAEAYWVTPTQVSKTPNPGEFLAKGAFIVRGKRTFLRAPTRLAVGEVEVQGARKIMGGPPAAIASRATRYVVLVPGGTPTNKVANELAAVFDVNVEEVQAVLPPASVEVVERVGLG